MKARIRKTGEIINIADYAKIDLDVCNSFGNPISMSPEEIELLQESTDNIDWEQRRYEIAKEMMPAVYEESRNVLLRGGDISYNDIAKAAVEFADMLIEELKKKKQ